jgi:hypothetical protein
MAMRFDVIVDSFQVRQAVIVASDYVVNCVSSWLVANVTDSFVSLQHNKPSGVPVPG